MPGMQALSQLVRLEVEYAQGDQWSSFRCQPGMIQTSRIVPIMLMCFYVASLHCFGDRETQFDLLRPPVLKIYSSVPVLA